MVHRQLLIANNTSRIPRTAIPCIIGIENARFGHFPGQQYSKMALQTIWLYYWQHPVAAS